MMIKAYKGFNPDMTCRGFKYEEGKTYAQNGLPVICYNGFHACLDPYDVFAYHPNYPNDIIIKDVYHVVYLDDMVCTEIFPSNTKICSSRITIGPEITDKQMLAIHANLCRQYKKFLTSQKDEKYKERKSHIIQTASEIRINVWDPSKSMSCWLIDKVLGEADAHKMLIGQWGNIYMLESEKSEKEAIK